MAKFIQLTTRKIKNLSLGCVEKRTSKIFLNTDHILLIRPNANDSTSCVIFVDGICSAMGDRDEIYPSYSEDADEIAKIEGWREDERSAQFSMIIVEESYEQVRAMLC